MPPKSCKTNENPVVVESVNMLMKIKQINFYWHLAVAGLIRLLCICYGIYHDKYFMVPYTDIDYKVFSDASRHVINNDSPYERHTYRYSPLIAILLVPNVLVHPIFGKVLFSLIDLAVGILIKVIVLKSQQEHYKALQVNVEKQKTKAIESNKKKLKNYKDELLIKAEFAAFLWLYNPLTIAIATRGNSDTIAGALVLVTLYLLQCRKSYFVAGLVHGLSIHFRLYPLIYSLAMFMYLSKFSFYKATRSELMLAVKSNNENKRDIGQRSKEENVASNEINSCYQLKTEPQTIFKKKYLLYFFPNSDQLKLIFGCILSIISLTSFFYYLYGYKFLYETYLYHLIRQDTRHNFSLYFYLQYLTAGVKNIGLWQKVLITLPQVILLLVFSFKYGLNKYSLNFCILVQTIVFVSYNSVLTSQYFVWILVVLPLNLWQLTLTRKMGAFLMLIWLAAQGAWLLPAYLLEFHGQNTFFFIWLQSVSFFCANIAILGKFIMNFIPIKPMKHE